MKPFKLTRKAKLSLLRFRQDPKFKWYVEPNISIICLGYLSSQGCKSQEAIDAIEYATTKNFWL